MKKLKHGLSAPLQFPSFVMHRARPNQLHALRQHYTGKLRLTTCISCFWGWGLCVEVRQAAREHAENFGANHPTQAFDFAESWRSQGELVRPRYRAAPGLLKSAFDLLHAATAWIAAADRTRPRAWL